MDTHAIPQGYTLAFLVQLRNSAERPLSGVYDGSEALALEVRPGDRRMALALSASGAAWGGTDDAGVEYTAADGVMTVTVDETDTAAIDPGTYRGAVRLTDGGKTFPAYEFLLRIAPGAGAEAAPAVYGEADDLTDAFPSLFDLEDVDTEQAAAVEPRAEARAWLDDQIVARAEAKLRDFDRLGLWDQTERAGLEAIRALLDADKLLVDEGCRRIVACTAVARVLAGAVGADGKNPYETQVAAFVQEARRKLAGWRARIDADGDGTYELVIG